MPKKTQQKMESTRDGSAALSLSLRSCGLCHEGALASVLCQEHNQFFASSPPFTSAAEAEDAARALLRGGLGGNVVVTYGLGEVQIEELTESMAIRHRSRHLEEPDLGYIRGSLGAKVILRN